MPDSMPKKNVKSYILSYAYNDENSNDAILLLGNSKGGIEGLVTGLEAKVLFSKLEDICKRSQEKHTV